MRVIAGEARGLVLKPPPGSTRPTMDRVRGAIFSSLGDQVPGARTLDLFAGSGAMGIEALSRGAASAVFVDADPHCAACIRDNLRRAHLAGEVRTLDVFRFLDLRPGEFDLIFVDPPYDRQKKLRDFGSELLQSAALAAALAPQGILVFERAAGFRDLAGAALSLIRSRRYGETEISFYCHP